MWLCGLGGAYENIGHGVLFRIIIASDNTISFVAFAAKKVWPAELRLDFTCQILDMCVRVLNIGC